MSRSQPKEIIWVGSKDEENLLKHLITGPEERLDRELRAIASFVGELSHNRPAFLLNWMRNNPDSDFVLWLRTFENNGR
jgi:hypothetical protein